MSILRAETLHRGPYAASGTKSAITKFHARSLPLGESNGCPRVLEVCQNHWKASDTIGVNDPEERRATA